MFRSAIIGLGDIANNHLAVLRANPAIELAAACDLNPALAGVAAGTRFYTDYHEMLVREKLDCVHICLPHFLHYPVAREAAERGIHVFCEKPPALNLEETLAFAALEADHPELSIGICLQNRRNESFETLMAVIAGGSLGKVLGIKALVTWSRSREYYSAKPWRARMATAGGGVMHNQSIHTLDLMQLIGGEIAGIRGSIANLLDYEGLEVEDTASARIRFRNGACGLFFATNANSKNDNVEIIVTLEKGELALQNNILYQSAGGRREPLAEDAKLPGTKFYYGISHKKLIDQFYAGLATGSQDYVHVRDAVTSMRMIDAIRRSSAGGQEIVFLPD